MRARVFSALLLLFSLSLHAQSVSVWPAQTFTGDSTGVVMQLNSIQSVGSAASGVLTLVGTSLTTVTFAVQASTDGGLNYFAIPVYLVASPTTAAATSITATASAQYGINLAGVTHLKIVTSGTFTATSVSFQLATSPNAQIAKGSSGGGSGSIPASGGLLGTSGAAGTAQAASAAQVQSALVGTSIQPKMINGVSYSVTYPGGLVARLVACALDAMNHTNGNTSGICDSSGEADVQSDSTGGTIAIGSLGSTPMTWIHPALCHWTLSGYTGGTADLLDLYGGSSIEGPTPVNNPCEIIYGGGTNSAYAVFQTIVTTSSNTYYKVKGMGFIDSSASLASGATMVVNATSDGSVFEDLLVTNYEPGQSPILLNDAVAFGQCCTTTFNRVVANGNYSSGPILTIIASNTNNQSSVGFTNVSLTHPGAGSPIISCTSANAVESLYFDDLYEEANKNDTTTALNQLNGCRTIKVSGMTVTNPGAATPTSGAIWQLNGTTPIAMDISGLTAAHGIVAFPIAIQNNISGFNCTSTPCNYLADANGISPHLSTDTPQVDVQNSKGGFQVAGNSLIPAGTLGDIAYMSSAPTTSVLGRVSTNPTLTPKVLVSVGTTATAVPATSTCTNFATATSSTCTASATIPAGNTAVCYVRVANSGATLSITDSGSNTWTAYGSLHTASSVSNVFTQTFYSSSILASDTTITAHSTISAGLGLYCDSTSAGLAATPTDGQCVGDGSSATPTCSTPITTTFNGDYIFCGFVPVSSPGTAGSGFTLGSNLTSGYTQYQVQSASGNITPAAGSGNSGWTITCSAFQSGGMPAAPSLNTLASLLQVPFTVASALSSTFQLVAMSTTANQVAGAPLGTETIIGVAQTVGGTGAQLQVAIVGKSTVRFDGTPVVGDLACGPPTSTGTLGLAHDGGTSSCSSQPIGVITGEVSGTGSGSTATVLLQIGN